VVPRIERIASGHPNQPYTARGESHDPHDADVPMREVGLASWYGRPFHGRRTSNGERYDMHRLSAAHKTMPLPSYARVRNLDNGREIVVRVNDRGPFVYQGRVIDLSYAAARKLGFSGLARVEIERITHDDIRTGAWRQPLATRSLTRGRSIGRTEQQALADTAPTTMR
jgi:rare lipoprotein A